MNKLLSILMVSCFSMQACQVTITNDTELPVFVTDTKKTEAVIVNEDGSELIETDYFAQDSRPVAPGETINGNFNPNEHARLAVKIDGQVYNVNQKACSDNHLIPITVSEILDEKSSALIQITPQ